MKTRHIWAVLAVLSLVASACASAATATPTSTPRATPTKTMAPTPAASPLPRATPTSTPRPSPTATASPSGPKSGGVIRSPQRADPSQWDYMALTAGMAQLQVITSTVFTRLFSRWSDKGHCQPEVYPVAIKSWRWVDDTTAEFTLKEGIRFQDRAPALGREATAQDLVATFNRYLSWDLVRPKVQNVDSVSAKDKYTFQMKMKRTWGGLLTELMGDYSYSPWLEPAELANWSKEERNDPAKAWVGSGPFMFKSYIPGVKTTVVRNPAYWVKGRPYVDSVEYMNIPDASTRFASMVSGKLNLAEDMAEEFVEVLSQRIPGLQIARCPQTLRRDTGIIWMNTTAPPFNDVRVRRAIQVAIDQKRIIDKLFRGRGVAIPVLPPATDYALQFEDFPLEVRQYMEYNPDKAKQLLTEAGYSNGFDTVVNFTSQYAAPSPMVSEAMADMLAKVGIRAKVQMHEYTRYVSMILNMNPGVPAGEMALTLRAARTPEDSHAFTTFWSKAPRANNRSSINDPEYDKLYEEFRASADEGRRRELARQIQILIANKAYAVRMPFAESTLTAPPTVHFTWVGNTADWGMMLENVWLD